MSTQRLHRGLVQQVRGTHAYAFRSGEWANVLTIAPTPVIAAGGPEIRDCYLVEYADGVQDFLAVGDPHAGYEFRWVA
jgi:hypothetical protein